MTVSPLTDGTVAAMTMQASTPILPREFIGSPHFPRAGGKPGTDM
jgi:hypothetical protein